MASIFQIEKVFEDAFGYKPKAFEFTKKTPEDTYADLGSPFYAKDVMGRNYYLPITLGGVALPYGVMSIRCRKTIVETPMVERDGSVREYISMDDYTLSIRGVVVNHFGQYPQDDLTILRDLWIQKKPLQIRSVLSDIYLKGNQKVVITNFEIPEYGGTKHVRSFAMELVEDKELTLEVE
jgi:Domain of unknown function (DUF6046)